MVLAKKWGILIKKESESLVFTGLEIPRDYWSCGEVNKDNIKKYWMRQDWVIQ